MNKDLKNNIYRLFLKRKSPWCLWEIYQTLGMRKDSTWKMTQVLLRENKIKKIRTGVYSLPTWSEAYSKPHKRIVESVLLNSEELTVALKVIARKSELSVKNTWKILQKLLSEGRVWKVDHGFYALRDEEI